MSDRSDAVCHMHAIFAEALRADERIDLDVLAKMAGYTPDRFIDHCGEAAFRGLIETLGDELSHTLMDSIAAVMAEGRAAFEDWYHGTARHNLTPKQLKARHITPGEWIVPDATRMGCMHLMYGTDGRCVETKWVDYYEPNERDAVLSALRGVKLRLPPGI